MFVQANLLHWKNCFFGLENTSLPLTLHIYKTTTGCILTVMAANTLKIAILCAVKLSPSFKMTRVRISGHKVNNFSPSESPDTPRRRLLSLMWAIHVAAEHSSVDLVWVFFYCFPTEEDCVCSTNNQIFF